MTTENKKPSNPQAYPNNNNLDSGMTLRDYFANSAMQGMIANPNILRPSGKDPKEVDKFCSVAYEYADAMLKQREL